jgi:sodium transport system permease protein
MRVGTVTTIFRKELIDTLRDRRTLIFMLLVPIVGIPLMMMGMSKLVIGQLLKAHEEKSIVVVIGAEYLPAELHDSLFQAEKLEVVEIAAYYGDSYAEDGDGFGIDTLKGEITAGNIAAAISIPEAFDRAIELESPTDVEIYYDESEVESEFTLGKIEDIFSPYKERIVAARIEQRDISTDILRPFKIRDYNVASARKVAGKTFGAYLPYIIIIICFMGAVYPAIDLAAGEKERGTLETLLVSPATRGEFVIGKYLVILLTAVVAALLALAALVFSMKYIVSDLPARVMEKLLIEVDPQTFLLIVLVILPLAGVFAAILLSVSIFAKSFKEAQSYLTALNMLVILPAFVSILPGIKLNFKLALIPVVNVSLISKEAISGNIEWNYVLVAFFSTLLLAALTLLFAKKWFERESVLFRT